MSYAPPQDPISNAAQSHYFVSKNGNDSNDGLSWVTAKLTVDAAKGNNRRIIVGPGTYAETLDWSGYSGIELVSAVKWAAKITASGNYTFKVGSSFVLQDIHIDSTATATTQVAVLGDTVDNLLFDECKITSAASGLRVVTSNMIKVKGCYILASESALIASYPCNYVEISDSFLATDGVWDPCNSYAVVASANDLIIKNCNIYAAKATGSGETLTGGILATFGYTLVSESIIRAVNTHVSGTGARAIAAMYGGVVKAISCYAMSSTTAGSAHDLYNDGLSTLIVDNTTYSTTYGTITDQQSAILSLVTP